MLGVGMDPTQALLQPNIARLPGLALAGQQAMPGGSGALMAAVEYAAHEVGLAQPGAMQALQMVAQHGTELLAPLQRQSQQASGSEAGQPAVAGVQGVAAQSGAAAVASAAASSAAAVVLGAGAASQQPKIFNIYIYIYIYIYVKGGGGPCQST